MTPKNTHGGSRGGGRPEKPESEKKGKNVSFRPSPAVAQILDALEQKKRTDFIEKAILAFSITQIKWKSVEKDGPPKDPHSFNPPYLPCIVYCCNPETPQGGVIEMCRWDRDKNEWLKSDVRANFFLQKNVITHYCDDAQTPVEMGLLEPKYRDADYYRRFDTKQAGE